MSEADRRSQKQRMLDGDLYLARDPQLVAERGRAETLLRAFNTATEAQERTAVLRALFGSCGEGVDIRPPFHCDYGRNIRVGAGAFANFGCVFLDVAAMRERFPARSYIGVQLEVNQRFPRGEPCRWRELRKRLRASLLETLGD